VTAFVDAGYSVTEKNEINNGLRGSSFTLEALNASVQFTAIPASMLKGQTYSITMTMKNESDAAWTAADGYALVAVSPQGNDRWGVTQRSLPVSSVASKATVTFTFDVTAPALAGLYPCHWQMARGGQPFGEIATGANKVRVFDEAAWGQNYPAVSGNYVAYEDYSGLTGSAVSVSNLATGGNVTLPDDIPFPLQWDPVNEWYEPVLPYEDFDISFQWFPDISGSWVTWMVDDYPPGDWFFQITAQDVTALSVLPLRITYGNSDALFPSVDGKYVVWEDYRNDPDGTVGFNFLDDNPDIFISDISDVEGPNDHFPPSYALCTATGPQMAPRISYPYVVWEDWRDTSGFQSDIYLYDLTVDSDGDGIPNWKETIKPSPDPAERKLTDTYWPEEFPDIQGTNVVWMDFRRDSGLAEIVDLYLADIAVPTPTAVATEPPTFRYHPRIQGTKVVWEDWRQGQPDIYWAELNSGAAGPIAATGSREEWPDISGDRVVYAKHRTTVQYDDGTGSLFDWDVYNIWTQGMLKDGSVAACTFPDVPGTFWAWERIEDCVGAGIASGYAFDGNFHPDWTVNRDQMAVFLIRALGEEPANPKDPLSWKSAYGYDPADPSTWEVDFSDVPATGYGTDGTAPYWAWFHIQRLYHTGVTKGVTATEFAPTQAVLRDQMAAFLVRALGLECANPCVDASCWPYDPANSATWAQDFADVPATGQDTCHGAYWAWFHIQAMFDTGITRGCGDGTSYCPEDPVRRDQMAVFLAKAFLE
jgi:beta propeller repeat protein